jgi:hypothetical protein
MITSAFENVKRLSDDQLQGLVEAARKGDMTAISALNLTSATPVLAEMMRRQQMRDMFQKNMMANQPDSQKQPTVADQILAATDRGIGGLEVPGVMDEDSESYASGGIVAFNKGGAAGDAGFISVPPGAEYEGEEDVPIERRLAFTPEQERIFREAQIRKDYERERAALGEAPGELTPEESAKMREDYLKQVRAVTDPYNKRLQALIERTRPDVAGETKTAKDRAEISAYLSMIGKTKPAGSGVGGSLYNTAQSILGGVEQYSKGIAALKKAEQAHAEAEMEGIKAESAREAGNLKDALVHERNQREARRDANRLHSQAERDLTRREKEDIRANIDAFVARKRAEEQARATAQREAAAERKAEIERRRLEGIILGRTGAELRAAEGRAAVSARQMMGDDRYVRTVTKELTAALAGVEGAPAPGTKAFADLVRREINNQARAENGLPPISNVGAPKPKEAPGSGGGPKGGLRYNPNTLLIEPVPTTGK